MKQKTSGTSTQNSRGKHKDSRRRLLKALAAGGGVAVSAKSLSSDWTRPVVEAAILPAHAQSSCAHSDYFNQVLVEGGDGGISMLTPRLCIHCNSDGTVNVRGDDDESGDGFLLTYSFSGNNIPLNQITNLSLPASCEFVVNSVMINVETLGAQAVGRLYIDVDNSVGSFEGGFELDPGACGADSPECSIEL